MAATLLLLFASAFFSVVFPWMRSIWVVQLGCVGIPLLVLAFSYRGQISIYGLPIKLRAATAAVCLGALTVVVNATVVVPLSPWQGTRSSAEQLTQEPLWWLLLSFGLLPAIAEESLFRGVVVRAFERPLGASLAVLIGALAFALFHFSMVLALPMLVVGLVAGALVVTTQSTAAAILFHLSNNSIALYFIGNRYHDGFNIPWLMSLGAVVLLAGFLFHSWLHVHRVIS